MLVYPFLKPFHLAALFIKEQLKEPIALFWIVVSPVATFYLIMYARAPEELPTDYLSVTSWFYAFVSSSVALFGLAFYIVGRRESGFLRSFVYTRKTKLTFLVGQFLAYSFMSVLYCTVFYGLTRGYFGEMGFSELVVIVVRFYVCFLLFSIPSLLLTLIPVSFQNASTLFSILSFSMLALGIASMNSVAPVIEWISFFNPMSWANRIMAVGVGKALPVVAMVVFLVVCTGFITFRYLLINPVWSRY